MKLGRWTLPLTPLVVALAVAPVALAVGPGEVLKVRSQVTLAASGYQGKVTASNPNCLGERTVLLKQRGKGVVSRAETNAKGSWRADLDELNSKLSLPAKVFAEVKPLTQATAGPIYRCLGATSRTVTIAGG